MVLHFLNMDNNKFLACKKLLKVNKIIHLVAYYGTHLFIRITNAVEPLLIDTPE